jgi:hypothetical protein
VTFSSSTPGSYTINIASVIGGKPGSLWNTSPAPFTLIVNPSDTTPPVIAPNISGTLGNNGWYTSDVDVSWTVTDPESVISTSGCNPITINADTAGQTLTCSATSTGGTNSQSVTIMRDATAPTASASASPAPNVYGWNNTNVTVSFSGNDSLSGIESCAAAVTLSSEGAGQSASGTCTDLAGNVSASAMANGINIDKTAPSLYPSVSPNPVYVGGSATATPNASDSLSGIDSQNCSEPDASSVGSKTAGCTATDKAGNTASVSASYSVIYNWNGFFQPVENGYVFNRVKAGSAIPLKFSLNGNQGLGIINSGYPVSLKVNCDNNGTYDDLAETVTAGSSNLSYDASADQYNYVWKTDKSWGGTCRKLMVQLIDGTDHMAYFQFVK